VHVFLAEEKFPLPIAASLIDLINGKHYDWLLFPVFDLLVVLLDRLPKLQHWFDFSFQIVHLWEFRDFEAKFRLPSDDCLNLILGVFKAFLVVVHHLAPLDYVTMVPDQYFVRVLLRLAPDKFLDCVSFHICRLFKKLFPGLHADGEILHEFDRKFLDTQLDGLAVIVNPTVNTTFFFQEEDSFVC
jgi:hypothetical protein